jgi:hypothetical protein
MKKQLLKSKILSFSTLVFLFGAFNVSQAQHAWVGGTSTDFKDATNWATTPVFNNTETFTVGAGSSNNPILGSAGYTLTSSSPTIGGIVINNAGNLTLTGNVNVNSATYWEGICTINGGTTNVRSSLYLGSSSTAAVITPTITVESGGNLNAKTFLIISNKQPGVLNVNGGNITTDSGGFITIGNYPQYATCNGTLNLNSGSVHARTNGLTIGSKGTVNIYGGLLDIIAGNTNIVNILNINGGQVKFLVGTNTINSSGTNTNGVININGGTMDIAGPLAIGAGMVNLNSGLMNFSASGALTLNGTSIINIDGGSLVLIGDQVTAMATYISSTAIKLSTAAATAGKTLSNTFDSVTGLTTIMAVLPGTAPSGLDYTTTAGVYNVGTAIADNTKSAFTLGTGTTATYTVSPALPAGLALDSTTGTISGTPTAVKALTTYYVKATTDYGFTTKAITIVISAALGVSEFKESAKIAVYPNPTTDFVTVSLSNAAAIQKISVYNNLGQLVRTETKNTFSLQNLAKGNYYLTIYTAEGNYAKKIIKQ